MVKLKKALYRSRTKKVIGGVCSGLANYFSIEPLYVRIIFVVFLPSGFSIMIYLLLFFSLPEEPGGVTGTVPSQINRENKEQAEIHAQEYYRGVRKVDSWWSQPRNIFALILILVGVVIALARIYHFSWIRWDFIWPALIVLGGLAIAMKRK